MPTLQEITNKVKTVLAAKAGLNITDIVDANKLTDFPLSLDNTALGFIAIKLNEYVINNNGMAALGADEVRKNGLTVTGLIKLINSKINVI